MEANGNNLKQLTNNLVPDDQPTWSPNGRMIAFQRLKDGNWHIYTMKTNGGSQKQLTNTPGGDDVDPAWSPDGTEIAFASMRDGNPTHIYLINVKNGRETCVTCDTNAYSDSQPAWSPDGVKIAFTRMPVGGGAVGIYIVQKQNQVISPVVATGNNQEPAWSPDGMKIAFQRYTDITGPEIFVMNSDGSNATQLTNNDFWDAEPDWQPVKQP